MVLMTKKEEKKKLKDVAKFHIWYGTDRIKDLFKDKFVIEVKGTYVYVYEEV